MSWRDKPELRQRLAAEYALGTLRGRARERFRAWLREDAALARNVAEWEGRLFPLALAVPEMQPPKRVWTSIADRIFSGEERARGSIWNNLLLWRRVGLLASGAAAALLAVVAVLAPQSRQAAPELPASYLALLSDSKTQKPVLLVVGGRRSAELHVRTLDPAIHVAGRSLELWTLPKDGAPRSLGLVPRSEKSALRLAAAADQALGNVPALAVSLEPQGGSPTGLPTGPVLYTGPCVRYW